MFKFKKLLFIFLSMGICGNAYASLVTYNYVGSQLQGVGSTQTAVGDVVTASLTFDSQFAQFGYPTTEDVVSWSVTTPSFNLSDKTGILQGYFPNAPFVISNGQMLYWDFAVGNTQVPYQQVTFTSEPLLGTNYYEYVWSQAPNGYDAKSVVVGQWSEVPSVPLPPALYLFISGLVPLFGFFRFKETNIL